MFTRSGRILPKEDADVAKIVQDSMAKDGVTFELSVKTYTQAAHEGGAVVLTCDMQNGETRSFEFDGLLVAAGRRANVRYASAKEEKKSK